MSREDVVVAIGEENIHLIQEYLLQNNMEQINQQDDNGDTLLHTAIKQLVTHVRLMEEIDVDSDASDVDSFVSDDSNNTIDLAELHNILDIILLLAKHSDKKLRNKHGDLAAHILLRLCLRQTDMVDKYSEIFEAILTEEGIEEECYFDGHFSLHEAVKIEKEWLMKIILKKGISVTTLDSAGYPALFHALECTRSSNDAILSLIHKDIVNHSANDGKTALMLAAVYGRSSIVLKLVELGADITTPDKEKWTALMYASVFICDPVSVDAYKALIHPNIVNGVVPRKTTPLHKLALRRSEKEYMEALLNAGADPDILDEDGIPAVLNYLEADFNVTEGAQADIFLLLLPRNRVPCLDLIIAIISSRIYRIRPGFEEEEYVQMLSHLFLLSKRHEFEEHAISTSYAIPGNRSYMTIFTCFERIYTLCVILRKGMGSRSGPRLDIIHRYLHNSDDDIADKILPMWDNPFSLAEECRFKIRACIHKPNREKFERLRLPETLTDALLMHDVAREACEILRSATNDTVSDIDSDSDSDTDSDSDSDTDSDNDSDSATDDTDS